MASLPLQCSVLLNNPLDAAPPCFTEPYRQQCDSPAQI